MTSIAHADVLLREWAAWSKDGGIIPKKLGCAVARWQFEVPSDYPEESERPHYDDDEMSRVDRVVAEIGRTNVRHYVVLLDIYRNFKEYDRSIEDAAIQYFANLYELRTNEPRYA